jgi:PAS domain S-box-containing protein
MSELEKEIAMAISSEEQPFDSGHVTLSVIEPDSYRVQFQNKEGLGKVRDHTHVNETCHERNFGRPSPCTFCKLPEAVAGGHTVSTEVMLPNNESLLVRWSKIQTTDGQAHILETIIDITERRQIAQTLEHLQRQHELFLSSAGEGIYGLDRHGNMTFVNPTAEKLLGWTAAEIIGKSMHATLHHSRADGSPHPKEDCPILAFKDCSVHSTENDVFWRKDGTSFPVEYTSTPIREGDEMLGVVVVFKDITDRRQAEERLRSSEERYRALYEDNPSMYFTVDSTGMVLSVNRFGAEQLGYAAEELVGQPVTSVFYEEDKAAVLNELNKCVKNPGNVCHWEFRKVRKDGTLLWVKETVRMVCDAQGNATALIVCEDITDLKRAEAEQQQSAARLQQLNDSLEVQIKDRTAALLTKQQQLRALASELSRAEERERKRLSTDLHDNLAQTLALGKMKLGAMAKSLKTEGSSTMLQDLDVLLDDALNYTRTLMSDLRPTLMGDDQDLRAAIAWVVEKMRRHGLRVTIEDDGQLKVLDEEMLTLTYRSIQELLYNVLKHAQTDEAIVTLRRSAKCLEATVIDRGAGFDPSTLHVPSKEGCFGLFSIRERVELLGGRLEVTSAANQGSCVKLIVPLKIETASTGLLADQHEGQSPKDPKAIEQESVGSKTRIMLADDHRMMREGLRNILEGQPDLVVVAEVEDGRMAVDAASIFRPDVIVMDVNMPRLSGVDATRLIKAGHPHVTIIGLSVYEDEKTACAMREAGAAAYLTKGGSFEALCATIRQKGAITRGL